MINQDISLDLYLSSLRLHRGHINFLKYYYDDCPEFLPEKHKYKTELQKFGYTYAETCTQKGIDLMTEVLDWDGIYTPKQREAKKRVEFRADFIDFWSNFPSTDSFEGFDGVRSLRGDKEQCSVEYNNILSEMNISCVVLNDALKYHIELTKELSKKEGKNKLTFLPNSLRYLKERRFQPYLGKGLFKGKDEKKQIIDTNTLF